MPRYASIDIGSNTLLLLIAEERDGKLVPVREECRFGRLAQGLAHGTTLSDEAIERCLAIAKEFRTVMDEAGVTEKRAVATQAVREAQNSEAFVLPANDILGLEIEVIEGSREAELVARAVAESFPELSGHPLVTADVGGASTEIIVSRGAQIEWVRSLPMGAVKLSEAHLTSDPPTPDQTRQLFAAIDAMLDEVELPKAVPLIGTAGTATSVASIELKMLDYDAERVHGLRLDRSTVTRTLAKLLELTTSEKRRLRGLEPQRADVIAGGVAIYSRLLERMDATSFIVSDRGVRWGLIHQIAQSCAHT
jgi:exopolyphosphatase/guanosine-5'-triphosphate,3'-diphosphate pyrophosphatase